MAVRDGGAGSGRTAHERLRRLLVMVPWVMARGSVSVDEVCKEFEMDRETLARDLDLLFICGLPPYSPGDLMYAQIDGEDVVISEADYFDRPFRLTRAEALTLSAMGRAALEMVGDESAGALRQALARLEGQLGGEGDLDVDVSSSDEVDRLRQALVEATTERKAVRIRYFGVASGKESERIVEPLKIVAHGGAWYLVAWCRSARDQRHFRVDRIAELTQTSETFDPSVHDDLDLTDLDLTPGESGFLIELRLSPRAARWLLDSYACEEVEKYADGAARVCIRASGERWAVDFLLRLGADVELIRPGRLKERVREEARKIAALYGKP